MSPDTFNAGGQLAAGVFRPCYRIFGYGLHAEISAEYGIPTGTRADNPLSVPSLGVTLTCVKPTASNPSR